jgi:Protein of unknown function (DUF4058)
MPIHDWTRVDAGTFHAFHHNWITKINDALNLGLLPKGFYVMPEQRASGYVPDVLALEFSGQEDDEHAEFDPSFGSFEDTGGGVATATMPKTRVELVETLDDAELYATRRRTLVVRHVSGDRIVALIELISPGNKSSTTRFAEFVDKARESLNLGLNLLIVDLFPATARDPHGLHEHIWSSSQGFTPTLEEPLLLASYRAGKVRKAYLEPIAVGASLKPMPLFLRKELFVTVPLESTYDAAFAGMPERWRTVLES